MKAGEELTINYGHYGPCPEWLYQEVIKYGLDKEDDGSMAFPDKNDYVDMENIEKDKETFMLEMEEFSGMK